MGNFEELEKIAKENGVGGSSVFWRPPMGESKLRILSKFSVEASHWLESEGKSIVCIGKENGCKYCGDKPAVKFLQWALVRGEGVKLVTLTYTVMRAIKELQKSSDWGFKGDELPPYDLVVNRKGEKKKTEYFVTPTPNKDPLTKEEQAEFKSVEIDIDAMIQERKDAVIDENKASIPNDLDPFAGINK